MKPVSPGILGFLTEVHIKPIFEYVERPSILTDNIEKIGKGFQYIYEKFSFFNKQPKIENELDKFLNYKQDLVYRLVGIQNLPNYEKIGKHLKLFNIFISKTNLTCHWITLDQSNSRPLYCSLSLLTDDVFSSKTIYTRLFIIEDFLNDINLQFGNNLFVDDIIFKHFNCDLGTRVVLKFISKVPYVDEISIHTKKNYLMNVEEEFKKYLSQHSDEILILNPDIPFSIGNSIICNLKFLPVESKFAAVDNDFVRNCKYCVIGGEEFVAMRTTVKEEQKGVGRYLGDISNYLDITEAVLQTFRRDCDKFEDVLIIGKSEILFPFICNLYIIISCI